MCLIQAAAWQGETLRGEYSFAVKQKFNTLQNSAYKIIDEINKNIKDNKAAEEYFDEQSSFVLDVARAAMKIDNQWQKDTLIEIIDKLASGELTINRSKDEQQNT